MELLQTQYDEKAVKITLDVEPSKKNRSDGTVGESLV